MLDREPMDFFLVLAIPEGAFEGDELPFLRGLGEFGEIAPGKDAVPFGVQNDATDRREAQGARLRTRRVSRFRDESDVQLRPLGSTQANRRAKNRCASNQGYIQRSRRSRNY